MSKPGRRREQDALYGKKKLSADAKVIWELLKNQPQTMEELCESAKISRSTLYRVSQLLDRSGIIKKIGEKYALWNFSELEETVANAVKYLRLELCRNPDVEEVAAKVGGNPESIRTLLFEHAPELNWKPPTTEEKEKAPMLCEKAHSLAAQIKYSLDDEIEMSEVSMDDIRRATFLLQHKLTSIKLEHLPVRGVLLGAGLSVPPSPKERDKKEIREAIQKLKQRKLE